jgi:hypothetical protein
MVVNMVLARVMEAQLKPVFEMITAKSAGGFTGPELKEIMDESKKRATDMNANASILMEGFSKNGFDLRNASTNLEGVSKGIAGITEDTALLLGGYLNSMRTRMFAHYDLIEKGNKFDIGGSMELLMTLQNKQINHLVAIILLGLQKPVKLFTRKWIVLLDHRVEEEGRML